MARDTKKIDSKGRFFLPSKLKDEMGTTIVVTNSTESGYLCVYTAERFAKIEAQISGFNAMKPAVSKLARRIVGEAEYVTLDSQGRIPVSIELWDRIHAKPGDDICVFNLSKGKLQICTKEFDDRIDVMDDPLDMESLAEDYYVPEI